MARADELTTAKRAAGPARVPWWCLTGAALAHLALLATGAQALSDWKRQQLLSKAVDTPVALKVRVMAEPADVPPGLTVEQPLAADPAPVAALAPSEAPASGPVAERPPDAQASSPAPQPVAPAFEPAVYVPRSLLSVGPVARTPVLLQWPATWPLRRSYTAILRLYLDEEGRVDRVEPDGDAVLPDALFETARQAFMAADFSPGQVDGRAVKSWVRIEVSFESGTPVAPH